MGLKQTVAPASSPITLANAKDHMYVTIADDDVLIQDMIDTATLMCENYTALQLVDATYIQTQDEWTDIICFLKSPISSLTSIKYYDEDNVQQTLDPLIYELDDFQLPNQLVRNQDTTLPTAFNKVNTIQIEYIAGYGTIPEPLRSWIKIQVATFYENRENFTAIKMNDLPNNFVDRLLDNYKAL